MAKLVNISGFPEWLPEQKLVEDRVAATVRGIYAGFGFTPIETPAVELLSTLSSKGEIDKEIYAIRRLQADAAEEAELALHYDLTVPFARYVAQHYAELDFPFKRYQMQKVWRGERPQKGRFREFYQFDIDTICRETVPLSADAEILCALNRAFQSIGIGRHLIKVNNRKILLGIYEALGLGGEQRRAAVVAIDKLAKIGAAGVQAELQKAGVSTEVGQRIVELAGASFTLADAASGLSGLGISSALFDEGCAELISIFALLPADAAASISLDLSLARGLDYYTGLILEVYMPDYPQFGSVGGGGRYDDLCGRFINRKLPGVGATFGLTRLMDLAISHGLLPFTAKTTSQVMLAVYSEEQRAECNRLADRIRACGLAAEVCLTSPKLGKQIDYAAGKGIPYVLFLNAENASMEIKDLGNKTQTVVTDLEGWCRAIRQPV